MHRIRMVAALVVMAVLVAACGARLSKRDLDAATRAQFGQVVAGQAGTGSGTGTGPGAADGSAGAQGATQGAAPGAAGAAGAAGAGSTGAGGSGGSGASGGNGGATASTLPPGGNGGATDVGVTATTISIGNVATLTGPVPGLFKGAVRGAQAFVAYQNSVGGVFGRKLVLKVGDDQLNSDENRAQIINLTPQVFAFVGSFSTFDDAGVPDMAKSGVPDVGYSLGRARQQMVNNFSPQPLPPGWRLGPLNYYKQLYGDAVIKHVGALVVNVTSSTDVWAGERAAMESVGYHVDYYRAVQPTENDYTADVVQMKRLGVQMFVMIHDATNMARVAKAMQQQDFRPKLNSFGSNAYDQKFLDQGGPFTEGTVLDQQQALYRGEDRATIPEVDLFQTWMSRVDPSFQADIFAAFGWAAGRLFVQALQAAGPRATRAGLLDQLRKIDTFDDNGMLAPGGPATKRPPTCWLALTVKGGRFVRLTPDRGFRCNDGDYFRLGG